MFNNTLRLSSFVVLILIGLLIGGATASASTFISEQIGGAVVNQSPLAAVATIEGAANQNASAIVGVYHADDPDSSGTYFPLEGDVVTVGSCAITFAVASTTAIKDVNCADNTALLPISSTASTSLEVVNLILELTNVSDPNHGALALAASLTQPNNLVTFTTAAESEIANGPIFISNSNGAVEDPYPAVSQAETDGVVYAAAVDTLTIAGTVEKGDKYSASYTIIPDTTCTAEYVALAGDTTSDVATGLSAAIMAVIADPTASDQAEGCSGTDFTTAADGADIVVTHATNSKTTYIEAITVTNGGTQVTFTPAEVESSAIFTLVIGANTYTYTAVSGNTAKDVVEALSAAANLDTESTSISCTEDDVMISCGAYNGPTFGFSSSVTTLDRSSGGGGGSSKRSKVVVVEAPTSTIPVTVAPTNVPGSVFISDLGLGSQGNEVNALQTLLKNKGFFTVDVTGYFGPITQAAVIAYQKAKGIPTLGIVGPATRLVLNADMTGSTTPTSLQTAKFSRYLENGMSGNDVTELQGILFELGHLKVPPTGFFGNLTEQALKEYQTSKKIDPLGVVGPKTREILNNL